MKRHAFTLVEIIIVLVLFGIMSGIIIESYMLISKISFRIGQDKELAKESLILSQVLDNLSQDWTIDYNKYEGNLRDSNGVTDELYLLKRGESDEHITIKSEDCEVQMNQIYDLYSKYYNDEEFDLEDLEKVKPDSEEKCKLVLIKNDGSEEKSVTILGGNNADFLISEIKFRVIPFDSTCNLLNDTAGDYGKKIGKPGFRVLGYAYSKFYNPTDWSTNSILPIQFFFGLKGKTENIYTDCSNEDE